MEERLHLRVATKERMQSVLEFAFEHRFELISVNPIRRSLEEHFQLVVDSRQPAADSEQYAMGKRQ
jgi:hypothetical protein